MYKHPILLAIAAAISSTWATAQNEFYVSPQGADINPGTQQQPFKSLTRARDAVRLVNQQMEDDIRVYLRGGNYPIAETIEFTAADSGTNGHRVYYQAFEDEVPVLNGGVQVTDWTKHDGHIYKATLDSSEKLRTLIVNGKRVYMAKQNAAGLGGWGEHSVTAGEADWAWMNAKQADGVLYRADQVADLNNASDVEISGNTTWNMNVVCVREVATEGAHRILKLQQPYGIMAQRPWWGAAFLPEAKHVLHNAYEFLDEPGEFYFDRSAKTLYYYTDGEDMSAAEVFAPQLCTVMSIVGTSKAERVENFTLKGITIAYTEAVLPRVGDSSGKTTVQASTYFRAVGHGDWHVNRYQGYDVMPNALLVSSARSLSLEDNTLKHIGGEGIGMINDVSDSKMIGNLCYDIGGSAVQVGHPQHVYEGDGGEHEIYQPDVEAVCRNLLIKNNVFYGMTKMYFGHSGITAFFTDGLNMEHNHIEGTTYSGVNYGWGWGNFNEHAHPDNPTTTARNNKFNYNRIYDCMNMLADGGAFYTLGSQPDSEAKGNFVKADSSHFMGVWYHDEGTAWYQEKDMVYEVRPGQLIFQINDDHLKHDIDIDNIYTTSMRMRLGAPTVTVTNIKHFPEANWPQEALDIIKKAGPEPAYHHLLKDLPRVVFSDDRRYCMDYSEQISGTVYEAENAVLSGGVKVNANHVGYSGAGFIDGFHNKLNAQATFKVNVDHGGTHALTIGYAAGFGDCTNISLYVNDQKLRVLDCPRTGRWDSWKEHVEKVVLTKGENTLTFKNGVGEGSPMNLDAIRISK